MAEKNLWDMYPLANGSWGNIWGFNDRSGDGDTIEMVRYSSTLQTIPLPEPQYFSVSWSIQPAGTQVSKPRPCYIPQPKDIDCVKRAFPDLADPYNPSWTQVEAAFVTAGHSLQDIIELKNVKAPVLLQLLVNLTCKEEMESPEKIQPEVDIHAPYMPPSWFEDEFGVKADRLRSAKRRNCIHAKKINPSKKSSRYFYSVPNAMEIWPNDVTYIPDTKD